MFSNNNKISSDSSQVFQNIHRKRSVLKFIFNKVSGIQPAAFTIKRVRHKRFFIEHLRTTASGRAQDFTKNGPNSSS